TRWETWHTSTIASSGASRSGSRSCASEPSAHRPSAFGLNGRRQQTSRTRASRAVADAMSVAESPPADAATSTTHHGGNGTRAYRDHSCDQPRRNIAMSNDNPENKKAARTGAGAVGGAVAGGVVGGATTGALAGGLTGPAGAAIGAAV